MSIHISCDMYLRPGLHVQIRLYYVLPYKAKILAQHGIGFILDRCIVYLRLTMPNLQKKRLLIFEIFNVKKYTPFFGTEYIIMELFEDVTGLFSKTFLADSLNKIKGRKNIAYCPNYKLMEIDPDRNCLQIKCLSNHTLRE